jgi:peptide/nickel transport system ATP-binding protein
MLDVSVRSGILRLLLDLRETLGMALLFVTHDLAVAKHVCDRIAVMQTGRIVEIGPSSSVLSKPSHQYTRLLMQAVPDIGLLTRESSDRQATPISQPRETSA